MARVTGQRARSTLPLTDTPDCQTKQSGALTASRVPVQRQPGMPSRLRSRALRTCGSPRTAAVPTRPGTPGRCLQAPGSAMHGAGVRPGLGHRRMLTLDLARPRIPPTGDSPSDAVAHQGPSSTSCSSAWALRTLPTSPERRPPRLRPVRCGTAVARSARRRPSPALPFPSIDTAPMSSRRMVRNKPGRRRRDLPVPARPGAPPVITGQPARMLTVIGPEQSESYRP